MGWGWEPSASSSSHSAPPFLPHFHSPLLLPYPFPPFHSCPQNNLPRVYEKERAYRLKLRDEREVKEMNLSSAFWLHVFDAEAMPRSALEYYFKNYESNPDLRALPERHKDGLDYLYARMAFVRSHPACAFWYVFWDDVWTSNRESMRAFKRKEVQAALDPEESGSLAYKIIPREELEARLRKLGLMFRRRLFTDKLITGLYNKLDEINTAFAKQCQAIADGTAPVPTVGTLAASVTISDGNGNSTTTTTVVGGGAASVAPSSSGSGGSGPAKRSQSFMNRVLPPHAGGVEEDGRLSGQNPIRGV